MVNKVGGLKIEIGKILGRLSPYIKNNFNLIELWTFFLTLVLFFPVFSSLLPSLGLDISNPYILIIILLTVIILLAILIYENKEFFNVALKSNNVKNLIFLTGIIAFLASANSSFSLLRDLNAPILHDPFDHAMMAKSILTSNQISFFYSPLLHSAAAIFSLDSITRIPWLITFFTQFAVLMIPIQSTFLFYHFTKSLKYSLILYLLLSTLHFPANFYYTAGKNSLILAISIIPTLIFLMNLYKNNRSALNAIKLIVTLFLLFMAHYPTFGIFLFLSIPWLGTMILESLKNKNFISTLGLIGPYLIGILMSIIWFVPRYYQALDLVNDSVVTPEASDFVFNIQLFVNGFIDNFNNYFIRFFQTWHAIFLVPLFIKKTNFIIKSTLVWIYISLTLLYFLVYTFNQGTLLGMVPNTLELIFTDVLIYILFVISTSLFLFSKLSNKLLIVFCVLIMAISVYSKSNLNENILLKQNQLNIVSDDDLQAFEFINTELPVDIIFLNGGQEAAHKKGVVYPVDGAMWLPFYTNNSVFIDYQQFSSFQTNYNNSLFQEILVSEDDQELINEIKEMGVKYGYIDQGVFGDSLSEEVLDNVSYRILFESGTVKIIEFN